MNGTIISEIITFIKEDPLITGLIVIVILLFVHALLVTRRISLLTKGADGKSLESTIVALRDRLNALEMYAKKNQSTVTDIDRRVTRAVQGVSVERFDPFENAGQQSFSTALLNEKGDGIVLSGIHSRDGVRVYAKSVSGYKSERELSKEEHSAVETAKNNINEK